MPEYGTPIRPSLPEGYSLADRLQREAYAEHHKVPGAARLAWVNLRPRGEVTRLRLAVLLRKPERWSEVADKRGLYLIPPLTRSQRRAALADYVAEYSAGWTAARLGQAPKLGCFKASRAYRDGWCDQREGRPKWHLAHCADHPACGAQVAARKAALALDLARDVPEHFVAYDAMARFVGLPANPWAMLLDDFDQPFSARAWTNTTRETPIAEQVARVLAQRFLFCEDEWQHLEVTDLRIADRADVFRRPNT